MARRVIQVNDDDEEDDTNIELVDDEVDLDDEGAPIACKTQIGLEWICDGGGPDSDLHTPASHYKWFVNHQGVSFTKVRA